MLARCGEASSGALNTLGHRAASRAAALWDQLPRAGFANPGSGVLFVDGINELNNLRDGGRNSRLLTISPAGSISLLAGNVTTGIESAFAARHAGRSTEPIADAIVSGTPADTARLADLGPPVVRASSDHAGAGEPTIQTLLDEFLSSRGPGPP